MNLNLILITMIPKNENSEKRFEEKFSERGNRICSLLKEIEKGIGEAKRSSYNLFLKSQCIESSFNAYKNQTGDLEIL